MKNTIVSCCLSSKPNDYHPEADPAKLAYYGEWAASILELDLDGVVIHDGLPKSEQVSGIEFFEVPPLSGPYTVLDDCWPLFSEWLWATDADNVFLVDIADVKFYRDPFPLVVDDSLYVCRETWPISNNSYTAFQIKQFYGNEVALQFTRNRETGYNSGIVGGQTGVVRRFVTGMVEEIASIGGGEQAAMNMILRRDSWKTAYGPPLHTEFDAREGPESGCAIAHK